MPTTVASSMAIPEPSTVAAITQRPFPLDRARGSATEATGGAPPASPASLTGDRWAATGDISLGPAQGGRWPAPRPDHRMSSPHHGASESFGGAPAGGPRTPTSRC